MMKQYETYELAFNGKEPGADAVNVNLQATFTNGDEKTTVKGFYDGDGVYKIRFYPRKPGNYHYQISGLFKKEGTEHCQPATGHGMVKVSGRHFKYESGQWFYPVGTTIYALVHQTPNLIDQTFHTLKNSPFNKIRTCVFPKHYAYNNNDPKYFPFMKKGKDWDVKQPDFRYWHHLEKCLKRLADLDIQCDLILFHPYDKWGFSKLNHDQQQIYIDYLTRRLAAFPNIWWSLANEYDLLTFTKQDWLDIIKKIRSNDPYHHLLSCHQMFVDFDYSLPEVTHVCCQTQKLETLASRYHALNKPIIADEMGYEGNIPEAWGNLTAFDEVDSFWKVFLQGGYASHGETFMDKNDILWWAKGGQLKGRSVPRLAFLKKIVNSLLGPIDNDNPVITQAQFDGFKAQMTKGPQNPIAAAISKMDLKTAQSSLIKSAVSMNGFSGKVGKDKVFLKYFSRHCTSLCKLHLPKDAKYRVDYANVWDMTRYTVEPEVSGNTNVHLPGKMGELVIAKKIEEK